MSLMAENIKIRKVVLDSVAGLSDEQANQKPDPEKWSIAQVLVHLYLMERGLSKWIPATLKNGEEHMTDQKPIHLVPNRTKKVKAPANFEPRDEFTTLEAICAKLSQSRDDLNKALEGVSVEQLEKKALPHPVFGPMSLKQWVELIGLHEKRHLEQIEEIKQELFGK
jgi:uncharacterized damage-inducible protein DinB